MKIACFARWDNEQWIPRGNNVGAPREPAIWPEGFDPSTLPIPRFRKGQRIRFMWDKGYLEGTIELVTCMLPPPRPKWWSEDRLWINYDVAEIGHRRSVYDYGDADITLVK